MAERFDADLWFGYVEGEVSPEEQAEFEKLLAEDPALRSFVNQLKLDRKLLRQLPQEHAPADLFDKVQLAVTQQVNAGQLAQDRLEIFSPPRTHRFPRWLVAVAVAAVLAIAGGVAFMTLSGGGSDTGPSHTIADRPIPGPPSLHGVNPTPSPTPVQSPGTSPRPEAAEYVMLVDDTGAPVEQAPQPTPQAAHTQAASITIRISSRNSQGMQTRVFTWCKDNNVKVDRDPQQLVTVKSLNAAGERMVFLIRGDQVPQLMAHLQAQEDARIHIQPKLDPVRLVGSESSPLPGENWQNILQQQLPIEPSVPIYDDQTQVILPVVFNEE